MYLKRLRDYLCSISDRDPRLNPYGFLSGLAEAPSECHVSHTRRVPPSIIHPYKDVLTGCLIFIELREQHGRAVRYKTREETSRLCALKPGHLFFPPLYFFNKLGLNKARKARCM